MFQKTLLIATSIIALSLATTAFALTSKDIRDAQNGLQSEGFYRGKLDGKVGPATRSAIARYQAKHGLKQTGHLDRKTLSGLREATAGAKSAPRSAGPSPN